MDMANPFIEKFNPMIPKMLYDKEETSDWIEFYPQQLRLS